MNADQLREFLHYAPDTGFLTWRSAAGRWGCIPAGSKAGSTYSRGYVYIRLAGRRYFAHRLAWLYVHGTWPTDQIDHINGNRADNRIENLRLATNGENRQNLRSAQANSKSGVLGVSWDKHHQKWHAQLRLDRKDMHLGFFDVIEAAIAARRAGELKYFSFAPARAA